MERIHATTDAEEVVARKSGPKSGIETRCQCSMGHIVEFQYDGLVIAEFARALDAAYAAIAFQKRQTPTTDTETM